MRYRVPKSHTGTTRMNLEKLKKHFSRMGKIATVSGYKVLVKTWDFARVEPRLMITDVNGRKMRLNGVLWGYMGEGPRGTIEVLEMCGMSHEQAVKVVISLPDSYYNLTNRKFERVFTVDFRKNTLTTAI